MASADCNSAVTTVLYNDMDSRLRIQLANSTLAGYRTDLITGRYDNDMCCVFCYGLAYAPTKITKCGHIACQVCIDTEINSNKICPSDGKTFTRQHIQRDTNMAKKIGGININCPMINNGCSWIGELKFGFNHLSNCDYFETKINNSPSNLVANYSTPVIEQFNASKQHMSNINSIVDGGVCCPLSQLGCNFKSLPDEVNAHLNADVSQHVLLLASWAKYIDQTTINNRNDNNNNNNNNNNIDSNSVFNDRLSKLEETVKIKDNEIAILKAQCKVLSDKIIQLESLYFKSHRDSTSAGQQSYTFIPYTWVINNIMNRKSINALTTSPMLYNSPAGYCFIIQAHLCGFGMGRDTHISLSIYSHKGVYDSKLTWPVELEFILTLLNQTRDDNHIEMRRSFKFLQPVSPPHTVSNTQMAIPDFVKYRQVLEASAYSSYIKDDSIAVRINILKQ